MENELQIANFTFATWESNFDSRWAMWFDQPLSLAIARVRHFGIAFQAPNDHARQVADDCVLEFGRQGGPLTEMRGPFLYNRASLARNFRCEINSTALVAGDYVARLRLGGETLAEASIELFGETTPAVQPE